MKFILPNATDAQAQPQPMSNTNNLKPHHIDAIAKLIDTKPSSWHEVPAAEIAILADAYFHLNDDPYNDVSNALLPAVWLDQQPHDIDQLEADGVFSKVDFKTLKELTNP
jgi:hypothetical protein